MVLPTWCVVCGALTSSAPCALCRGRLGAARRVTTVVRPPPGIGSCHAPFSYDGAMRDLLTALKYRNRREALGWLATELAPVVAALGGRPSSVGGPATVVWAPTSAARRHRRGFDQAELLAKAVGRAAGLPVRALLLRRPGEAQTGRSAQARRAGPSFAVRAAAPAHVLVVDDVGTTGATLEAAASALRAAGVVRVDAVVAAWTPPVPAAE